jgi:hypothetical protein
MDFIAIKRRRNLRKFQIYYLTSIKIAPKKLHHIILAAIYGPNKHDESFFTGIESVFDKYKSIGI